MTHMHTYVHTVGMYLYGNHCMCREMNVTHVHTSCIATA